MTDTPSTIDAAIIRLIGTVSEREHMGVVTQDVLDLIAKYRKMEQEVERLRDKNNMQAVRVAQFHKHALDAERRGREAERADVVAWLLQSALDRRWHPFASEALGSAANVIGRSEHVGAADLDSSDPNPSLAGGAEGEQS